MQNPLGDTIQCKNPELLSPKFPTHVQRSLIIYFLETQLHRAYQRKPFLAVLLQTSL